MVIEMVILIGWVENVALNLSELLKRNGEGDLIMGSGELLCTRILWKVKIYIVTRVADRRNREGEL